jgi:uncharacterized membrane protein YkgB
MNDRLNLMDGAIIRFMRRVAPPFTRLAIFVVFFWFGLLKVIGASPANPLVSELLSQTLPFITFEQFIVLFGIYEMIIGILFIFPRMERSAIALLALHMVTTVVPLILVPEMTWQNTFVPTMEGQYIIKNVVIIALAMSIAANLKPLRERV